MKYHNHYNCYLYYYYYNRLKEWIEKAPEREREKKEKEEGKKKKKTAEVKYFYDGTTYDQQKEKIQENFEDALKQGRLLVIILFCQGYY